MPRIPVEIQLEKAEAGPTSWPTWRLSHLSNKLWVRRRTVATGMGSNATTTFQRAHVSASSWVRICLATWRCLAARSASLACGLASTLLQPHSTLLQALLLHSALLQACPESLLMVMRASTRLPRKRDRAALPISRCPLVVESRYK
jgi:hypothetical protein